MSEEILIVETNQKRRKPKSLEGVNTPCRLCGEKKDRLGWYCVKCNEIKIVERRKKSGMKPNYQHTPCKGCNGVRDRATDKSKGYYCNACIVKRKTLRREVKNELKEEMKNKFIEKISTIKTVV